MNLTLTPVAAGTTTMTVTAKDGRGGAVSKTITVRVNRSPQANGIADQATILGVGIPPIDLTGIFQDPDGDTLTLSAKSQDESIATVALTGNQLTIATLKGGTTTITITAVDGQGGSVSTTFEVSINQVPHASNVPTQTVTLEAGAKSIDLSAYFTDPDGDTLTLTTGSADTSIATVAVSGTQLTVTPHAVGSTTLTVTAQDGRGGSVSKAFALTVKANEAPQVISSIPNKSASVGTGTPIDLSAVFSDPDGDSLTYEAVSSDDSVATATVSGSQLMINPLTDGTATITVTAKDPHGRTVTTTFTVSVSSNRDPQAQSSVPEQVVGGGVPGNQIPLSNLFSDPDGDVLTYSAVAADGTVVDLTVSNGVLNIMPKSTTGTTTVTVTATDGKGGTATQTFTVRNVQVVQNETIRTKTGIGEVVYDLAQYIPNKNTFTVYTQNSNMTMSGAQTLNGAQWKTTPGSAGTSEYWIVADNGTAVHIQLTVENQTRRTSFISDYVQGQMGVLRFKSITRMTECWVCNTGYELEFHQYVESTHQMRYLEPAVFSVLPGYAVYHYQLNFYDFFDITNAWYYNEEAYFDLHWVSSLCPCFEAKWSGS